MLAAPLPGLVDFSLVGPGATNGVLTAQTMASYSDDPTQVEHLFDQYSAESGFAGWIKTWQDRTGTDQVVEIAIRFHDTAEASTNSAAFVTTLAKGLTERNADRRFRAFPDASAFSINEPATTSGSVSVPAQQVQAVVYSDDELSRRAPYGFDDRSRFSPDRRRNGGRARPPAVRGPHSVGDATEACLSSCDHQEHVEGRVYDPHGRDRDAVRRSNHLGGVCAAHLTPPAHRAQGRTCKDTFFDIA